MTDRGEYRYLLNGESTDISESWSRETDGRGNWQIDSERRAPGVHLAVRARGSGGRVTDFALTWESAASGNLAADYRPGKTGLVVRRWQGSQVESLYPAGADDALLSPLMRIFAGPLIAELLLAGGEGTVVVPDIRDPADPDQLLRPLVSQRHARVLAEADGLREVEYRGDQYGPGTRFWLATDDLLQRYCWRQSDHVEWDVQLVRTG